MSDLVDEFFPDSSEEFYPGSKKKRKDPKPNVEFIADPWEDNYSLKSIKGVDTKMYPIGALASALGVSVPTVRYWTRKGHIPDAPFRLPSNMVVHGEKVSGRRLFTADLINACVESFEERGLLGKSRIEWKNHSDLSIEIHEKWTRIINNPTTG